MNYTNIRLASLLIFACLLSINSVPAHADRKAAAKHCSQLHEKDLMRNQEMKSCREKYATELERLRSEADQRVTNPERMDSEDNERKSKKAIKLSSNSKGIHKELFLAMEQLNANRGKKKQRSNRGGK